MSQSLDEFIKEAQGCLESFKQYWLAKHNENPTEFPMELPDNNVGLWWEFFSQSIDDAQSGEDNPFDQSM